MFAVTTTTVVDASDVADAMISAFEGGSTYWCQLAQIEDTERAKFAKPWYTDPKFWESDFDILVQHDRLDGGHGHVTTHVRPDNLRIALVKMAEDYPTDFHDIVGEDAVADSNTGDILWQICVLGAVEFG